MSEQTKNPQEYGYLGDEIIAVPVRDFWALRELVDEILQEETKPMFPEKYHYVNRDTGKVVEKLNEKNKPNSVKVVNIEETLDAKPTIYRTPRGMNILKMKMAMSKIHMDMITSGVAKHIPTLQAEQEKQSTESEQEK